MPLTIGSLFSGIGGFETGLERAIDGAQTIFQVEQSKYCLAVLQRLWPHTEKRTDVRTSGKHNLPPVDVLCGGFPCQDIANQGTSLGLMGSRSGLWFEFERIIRETRPTYVALENVPRLLQLGFGRILSDLSSCGYDAEWSCVPAAAFGAPHYRDRLMVLAYPKGHRGTGMVPSANSGAFGQWWQCHPSDLRTIASAPFERGDRWPQPLIRGMDDGTHRRMDRLKAIGNCVVPDVAELLGRQIAIMEGLA